ncbi:dolichyl-P-Glc:Glc2Man9GlcNAc2-PP-dolichol alpha-1,2-glucosyltransferase [Malassezia psittaci]|uniref:Dol-P-Glc:Glc(2)Man(9)GlcNAc(2)-PP-Dol alpha-1,2-glucosyltransferase n=1 Tax=Malassezia psittaci TaxID=1821823 RepID=A0AAF0JF08_9BASI|nr:dolichyl-P-Glc:Glc2Man9GlcNAc2-PP-dolichol alpha-1,2-glucosyltransferase [Malassezia psittaci]
MHPAISLVVLLGGGITLARYASYTKQLFDSVVSSPYMDEVFHVPQAIQFCNRNWVPEPKVTTPPGLYWLTLLYQRLGYVGGWDTDVTKLSTLRTVSLVALMVTAVLSELYLNQAMVTRSQLAPIYRFLVAVAVATIPTLYFFGFLFYTDSASTMLVVMAMALAESDQHLFASVSGLVAISVRQTNAIWLAFIMGCAVLKELQKHAPENSPSDPLPLKQLLSRRAVLESALEIVLPYAPSLLLFVGLVIWNGGDVALGDKTNHQPAFHMPQILYFFAFALFVGWPALLPALRGLQLSRSSLTMFSGISVLGLAAVHFFTYTHPFMLADNRHYMFYVWRRIINVTPWSRYALVPLCVASGMLWISAIAKTHNRYWIAGFLMATSLTLVPAPLIEPRYFIVPYIVMRLALAKGTIIDARSIASLVVEIAWHALIISTTIYTFIYKPFSWPNEQGLQRFMW